jgi:hypothetical protein
LILMVVLCGISNFWLENSCPSFFRQLFIKLLGAVCSVLRVFCRRFWQS